MHFNAYFEPFVGSGALFFDLAATGAIGDRPARLSDVNRDLLGTYGAIARDPEIVIAALVEHEREHRRAPRDHFYRVRDQLFNPWRMPLFGRDGHRVEEYPTDLAAMFIYLNRTAFNGLFRLNSRGGFNVPVGRYVNPRICDSDNLRAVSSVLVQPNVTVAYDSFERILDRAGSGDLLYFDPPYAPLSETANFTGYTAAGFNDFHQRQLQQVAIELAKRGCYVIMSNSTAPIIRELYDRDRTARAAGLRAHRVKARRAINSRADKRGDVAEYVISNVPASH
jgi:DNA adenine methylase